MKAISLWEPWATAIARGLKGNETRSWATSYRGRLVICAARTTLHADFIWDDRVRSAFAGVGVTEREHLAFGNAVAIATVVDCVRTEEVIQLAMDKPKPAAWLPTLLEGPGISELERALGDYTPGRWAWILRDVQRLVPVPVRGSQGFFEVPDHLLKVA